MELQSKTSEQEQKFYTAIKSGQSVIQDQINTVNQKLHEFIENYKNELKVTTQKADEVLKAETDEYNTRVQVQFEKNEREIAEKLSQFQSDVALRQESQNAAIDATMQEFNAWKVRIQTQLDDADVRFKSDLKEFEEKSRKENEKIFVDVEKVQNDTREIMAQLKDDFTNLVSVSKKFVADQNSDNERQMKEIRSDVKATSDEFKKAYRQIVDKLNQDTNALQVKIDDINKGIAKFTAETGVFEKADILKKQLDEAISDLKEQLADAKEYDDKINDLNTRVNELNKLSSDVNSRINSFAGDRSRINELDSKFSKLMAISDSMDGKILDLNATSDNLTNMQAEVRKFQETLAGIQTRYDRLENKGTTIDHVAEKVDDSFENIKSLEQRIEECSHRAEQFPVTIEKVQNDIEKIMKSSGKVNEAIDKLASLDKVLDGIDARYRAFNSEKGAVADAEEKILRAASQTQKEMDLLKQIAQRDVQKSGEEKDSDTPSVRKNVRELRRQGWTEAQIAKKLNLTRTEVRLMLQLED